MTKLFSTIALVVWTTASLLAQSVPTITSSNTWGTSLALTSSGITLACNDSSGSGTAQVCSTTPSVTPASGTAILYSTTTTNTGDVTVNVNSTSAVHIRKFQGSSTLSSGDLKANVPVSLVYDGTYWELGGNLGNAPSVSNSDGTLTISPTTGAVVASLALGNANTWTALQTFGAHASIASTAHGVLLSENTGAVVATLAGASGAFLQGAGGSADPAFNTLTSINPQTATYQVLAADFTNYKTITVASGSFTITLVASGSQPAAGEYINIINYGSGTVTIARSGQNINGGTTSLTLGAASATAPQSVEILSDGTNYFAAGLAGTVVCGALPALTGDASTSAGSCATTVSNLSSVTNASLPNTGLVHASITIGGTLVALGGSTSSFPSPGAIGGTTPSTATFTSATVQNGLSAGGTAYSYGAPSTTGAAAYLTPATTYTVTGTSTTGNFQENYFGAPTFTDASSGTVTDAFNTLMNAPAAAGGSLTITRSHTLGIVDSTSAASSITGGLVVSATLGTTATSVGIGGGNINAGGSLTLGTALSVANGGTGDTSATAYAPILGGTTSTGALQSAVAGTSGQVFVSQGASTKPTYIDYPDLKDVPAANCNNTNAGAGWSIGSGGTVTCRAGTNNLGGYVAITDTSSTFAQFAVQIPEDWDTGTDPYIRFHLAYPGTDGASAHTIIPQIKVSCAKGDGSTSDDVTFNAAHSSSTITLSSATANLFFASSNVQMNSTDVTGCVAGSMMIIQVGRATDTATSAANFYSATITFPRLIVVQAN